MNNFEKDAFKSYIIKKILDTPFKEAIEIYSQNLPLVQDVNFIFPNNDGIDYLEKFQKLNLKDIGVNYFFSERKLFA